MEQSWLAFSHHDGGSTSGGRSSSSLRAAHLLPASITFALLLLGSSALRGADRVISAVEASRAFFNPTIGQTIEIRFSLSAAGTVDVSVVGPTGEVVRSVKDRQLDAGPQSFQWDGRDADGVVVPNEAYSLKIAWAGAGKRETYDTGRSAGRRLKVEPPTYDTSGGVLSYTLPKPGRVLLRATCLSPNPRAAFEKAIVSDEPRVAGPVVDVWNGFDESGKVFLPDRPGFVVTIEARELPAPAIITIGNRATTDRDHAARRKEAPIQRGGGVGRGINR